MPKVRVHAFVSGRVQGINFRYHTRNAAQRLNLTGWVRNLSDGRVEVVAEGEEEKVNRLVKFLKKGPLMARIDNTDIKRERYTSEFPDFRIRY